MPIGSPEAIAPAPTLYNAPVLPEQGGSGAVAPFADLLDRRGDGSAEDRLTAPDASPAAPTMSAVPMASSTATRFGQWQRPFERTGKATGASGAAKTGGEATGSSARSATRPTSAHTGSNADGRSDAAGDRATQAAPIPVSATASQPPTTAKDSTDALAPAADKKSADASAHVKEAESDSVPQVPNSSQPAPQAEHDNPAAALVDTIAEVVSEVDSEVGEDQASGADPLAISEDRSGKPGGRATTTPAGPALFASAGVTLGQAAANGTDKATATPGKAAAAIGDEIGTAGSEPGAKLAALAVDRTEPLTASIGQPVPADAAAPDAPPDGSEAGIHGDAPPANAGTSASAPAGAPNAATAAAPPPAAASPATDSASAATRVPISELAVTVAAQIGAGKSRFEVRLDPPDLGRIDVQLNMDSGGNVGLRLTAERPETLDLLRRDAPELERALQNAGLDTGGGMQFSLGNQGNHQAFAAPENHATTPAPALSVDEAPALSAAPAYASRPGRSGGVDISV